MKNRLGGVRGGIRAVVRQLSAAVYALVALSLLSGWLRPGLWGQRLLELVVVGGAAAIFSRLVSGPFWTRGLVGPLVGLFDLAIVLFGHPEGPGAALSWRLLLVVLSPSLSGLLGTFLASRGRKPEPAPEEG